MDGPTGFAVVRGRMADGRQLNVAVPYVEVPGFPFAAPIDEAWRLAREKLQFKLRCTVDFEASSGLWACCRAEITAGRHAEDCSAAHVDGTPR